jgi:hypothetical protein
VEAAHLMLIAAQPSWKPFVSATNSVKLNLPPSKSFGYLKCQSPLPSSGE